MATAPRAPRRGRGARRRRAARYRAAAATTTAAISDDRRPRRARQRRDEAVDVRGGDQAPDRRRARTPARVGQQQVHERPAVGVQQRARDVAGEPCGRPRAPSAGAAAARAPRPMPPRPPPSSASPATRRSPAASARDHASSEVRHSPENSALVMNPRAGLLAQPAAVGARARGWRSAPPRADRLRGEPLGHREAVDPRQLDVEQDDVRAQAPGLLDGRLAVGGLADDLEPVGLEQRPRARPKAAWSSTINTVLDIDPCSMRGSARPPPRRCLSSRRRADRGAPCGTRR